jgi:integrase
LAAGITKLVRRPDHTAVLRPRLTFHSLRHAAASLFIDQGWPAKKVQTVMGHSSIQVTYDIYGKLWTDLEKDLSAMAHLERDLLG